MHLSVLEGSQGSPIFTSCFAMSSLLGIFVFGLTNCDACWTSFDFWDRSCRTGSFKGLGGLGPMDLLGGTSGAWPLGAKVKFLVLSTLLSGPTSYSGLIVKLYVSSIWFSVSLLDELSSSTKTSSFFYFFRTFLLDVYFDNVLTVFCFNLILNCYIEEKIVFCFSWILGKTNYSSPIKHDISGRVSLRASMSCNRYAVLLLSEPRKRASSLLDQTLIFNILIFNVS